MTTGKNNNNDHSYCRPFLKWAGNKYRIMDEIHQMLPNEGDRLIEPFAGSAAVFLNTNYKRYLITDSNPDLINLYNHLKKEGDVFIGYCKRYFSEKNNTADRYYYLRNQFNKTTETRKRSALFLYLNRHGYNGLCRYNAKGGFNVPFGRYKAPYFPQKEMTFFSQKAKRATFQVASFEKTLSKAKPGDVVYCDPPYVALSNSANFTTYSAGGFSDAQQLELVHSATKVAAKGIPVLISNHKTKFTDEIYKPAKAHSYFKVRRYISCNGAKRESAGEVLALFK
jgi:DNA adenine methylase